MPEVKVTHDSLKDPSAKEPPPRDPVPPGIYQALITSAVLGVTKGTPILQKVSVQFQIMFFEKEDGAMDDTYQGRTVYQDYIPERDPGNALMSQRRRYELVQLLEAAGAPYSETSFNTDHLVNKVVRISVRHRTGKQPDENGKYPVFANVTKVDTTEAVAEGDLV